MTRAEWTRLGGFASAVVLLHVAGFGLFLYYLPSNPALAGLASLAYTFGLRHAFDADHIAAIDNTTRKFLQDGQRPLGTGFFFSLGHSSVVFGLTLLLSFGIKALDSQVQNDSSSLRHYTSLFGTGISGFFLYLIAGLNIVIMVSIIKVFRALKRGEFGVENDASANRVAGEKARVDSCGDGSLHVAKHFDGPVFVVSDAQESPRAEQTGGVAMRVEI